MIVSENQPASLITVSIGLQGVAAQQICELVRDRGLLVVKIEENFNSGDLLTKNTPYRKTKRIHES